jgi:hypothetical protein
MNLGVSCTYLESRPYWTRPSGEGFDEDSSKRLWKNLREAIREYWTPEVISRGDVLTQLREELEEISQECSQEGWDNYGASPINQPAIEEAWKVLEYMPLTIGIPEIVPEPHGGIGLEWRKGPNRVLVLSVVGQHKISFAAIFEGGDTHGTEYFEESLPLPIFIQFRRFAA